MKKFIFLQAIFVIFFCCTAFANTYDISEIANAKVITDYNSNATVEDFDTISFGNNEWIVLEKSADKAFLLSKYSICELPIDDYEPASAQDLANHFKNFDWSKTYIRKYLNGEYYDSNFNETEKSLILPTRIKNKIYTDTRTIISSSESNDKCFLLSCDEFDKYLISKNHAKTNNINNKLSRYFLRDAIAQPNFYIDGFVFCFASSIHFPTYDANNSNAYETLNVEGLTIATDSDEAESILKRSVGVGSLGIDHYVKKHIEEGDIAYAFDGGYVTYTKWDIRPALWVDISGFSSSDSEAMDNYETTEQITTNYNDNNYSSDDNINIDGIDVIVEDSTNDNSGTSDTSDIDYNNTQNTIVIGLNGLDVTFKISELHSGFVQDVSGRWFYFDKFDTNEMSGSFATGWREVNGKTYYFDNNGIMQSNKTIDGIKLGADGAAIITVQETTKAQVKNGWVGDYYYENGVLVKNRWVGDYYVGSEGKYVKNQWVSEYYIGADGKYVRNKWIGDYYVGSDGKMLKNTITPDGYRVGSDGKYIQNNNVNAEKNSSALNNNTDNNSQSKVQNDKPGETKSYNNNDVTKLPRKHREYDSSKIYYYAKQEGSKKFITSIKRKDIKDGLFGTGIFAKNTYHDIEIKISNEMNKTFNDYLQFRRQVEEDTDTNWVLLAGDSIKTLEVINDCITFTSGSSVDTGMLSFYNYNNGTIQLYCISEDKRNTILNKLQTSKIIMLASPKIINSNKKEYENYTLLGGFTKYRPYETKDLNILEGYVNCENKILEYSKHNIGKYIYVLDGMFKNEIYVELITKPLTSYKKIDIHTGALPPNVYKMYAKKVDYYAKTGDDFWDSFSIYGGDIVHHYELRLDEEIIDYKYFYENYNNYTWVYE